MSSPSRKRFVVPTPDGPHELFSALQVKSGDVQVFVRSALNFEARSFETISHEKFSIHRSPASSGTTIVKTLNIASSLRASAFIEDSSVDLCWLFYARACPDIRNERYRLKVREKDEVIEIAEAPTAEHSLFFFLLAQRKTGNLENIDGFRLYVKEFEHFNLGVYTTYVDIPTSPMSYQVDITTSNARLDQQPMSSLPEGGAVSLPLKRVAETVLYFCANIAEVHLLRTAFFQRTEVLDSRGKNRVPFLITSTPSNSELAVQSGIPMPYPPTTGDFAYGDWAIHWMENVNDGTPFQPYQG